MQSDDAVLKKKYPSWYVSDAVNPLLVLDEFLYVDDQTSGRYLRIQFTVAQV